jgi:hypothetical protein
VKIAGLPKELFFQVCPVFLWENVGRTYRCWIAFTTGSCATKCQRCQTRMKIMRLTTIVFIMAACIITNVFASAQMQAISDRTYTIDHGLVQDLGMMNGIMSDINAIISHRNISIEQKQQLMNILGRMGGVMQQIASAKEVEGWQLSKQHRQLYEIKKKLDELKKHIERN